MVMARDTASDLVKNEQARLEKIRKQKPKGDDPIEIAESRMEIRRQEQEQQGVSTTDSILENITSLPTPRWYNERKMSSSGALKDDQDIPVAFP